MNTNKISLIGLGKLGLPLLATFGKNNQKIIGVDVDLNKIVSFEASLLSYLHAEHAVLLAKINESGDYNADIEAGIRAALDKFKSTQTW